MIVNPGDKVHVMLRRILENEPRRHIVGTVATATSRLVEVRGYTYFFDAVQNTFDRASNEHTRVISLTDAHNLITFIPDEVQLNSLHYIIRKGRYVITDGDQFALEVNEFGTRR
jgi:hypothetical protein